LYRYSHRLSWSLSANTFARLLYEKHQTGAKLLDLTISNPIEAFEDYPHESIARAYHDIQNFEYRPDPFGLRSARCAISDYYAARGVRVSPEQLLLTASTSEAYSFLFKLFCDPGDEVLAPTPSYPLFEYLAGLESVRITPYRLLYDGSWFLDLASLRQGLSSSTRAIIIVNPNNPTGSFLNNEELQELFCMSEEHRLPIISDEVFFDYCFAARPIGIQSRIGNNSALTFCLNGLSKTVGMPQMKLAWVVISGPVTVSELARQRLELISDTYLSVATPVQCALPELLRIGAGVQQHIRTRIEQNLQTLKAILEGSAAHVLHAEGGWSAIIQLPAVCTEDIWVARLLNEHGIIVQPGYFFDLDSAAHVVVSLITPPEIFDEAVQKLKHAVDD
jgi:aspartate/methionine/tyrosine aminotransferase